MVVTASTKRRRDMWVVDPSETGSPATYARPGRTTSAAVRIGMARPVGAAAEVVVAVGLGVTWIAGEGYDAEAMYAPVPRRVLWGPTLACALQVDLGKRLRTHLSVADLVYPLKVNWFWGERTTTQHDFRVGIGLGVGLGS
jgi:hypothetical protein